MMARLFAAAVLFVAILPSLASEPGEARIDRIVADWAPKLFSGIMISIAIGVRVLGPSSI